MSADGTLLVSLSNDKSIKVFDVPNIDMMAMLRLPYIPACAEWAFRVRYLQKPCRNPPPPPLTLLRQEPRALRRRWTVTAHA